MNDATKKAGIATWMLLTGALAAPAVAQDDTAVDETATLEAAETDRTVEDEVVEGSGDAEVEARPRRREQTVKARRHREMSQKQLQQ